MTIHAFLHGCLLMSGVALSTLHAETRTLTDRQGRSIQADVIAVEGDQAQIRRADGQMFNLPLSSLSEKDERELKEWAAEQAKKPPALPPGSFEIQLSRLKFDSTRRMEGATNADGVFEKDVTTIIEDKWGYTITLVNKLNRDLTDLRIEYILFANIDDTEKKGQKNGLRRKAYRANFPDTRALARTTFRTETVTAIKTQLKSGWIWTGSNATGTREQLYGMWMKLYRGNELIHEIATPEGLARTEKWPE